MTTFLSEDGLVGLVSLGLIVWIGWTMRRGLRRGLLPIGRSYVDRDERPGAFGALLAFYAVAALFSLYVSLNLLFGIGTRDLI